ncbi:MAG: TolC family protein [Rubrivivax sp.]
MFRPFLRPRGALRPHPACGACVFVLSTLLASAVQAQSVLTFDDAMHQAQARSLLLPAQDVATLAARERAVAAGRRPDPVLKAALTNLPVDGPDRFSLTRDFMTMRSVGVMQEFTRADKRLARSARFDREAALAQAMRRVALADLQRDTAIAWLELHYLTRMHALIEAQREEAALPVQAADAAYRGGRGTQVDAIAARSAVAAVGDRLRLMARNIATARTRLARWVGEAGVEALGEPPAMAGVPWSPDGLDEVLEQHPRIVWLAQQEALARALADVAGTERRSDWSGELMFSKRGPAYSNMVSLSVSIPLQWDAVNRQDREWSARQSLAQQARDERDEALREVRAQTRSAIQAWQANRERLAQYDASLLPLAAEQVRAAQDAYRGATAPLAAVLDARRVELDTRLERLRIERETAVLWAQLNYLIPGEAPVQNVAAPAKEQSR